MIGGERKQVARILEGFGIKKKPDVPATTVLPEILKLKSEGKTVQEIAEALGFNRKAIFKALRKHEQQQKN